MECRFEKDGVCQINKIPVVENCNCYYKDFLIFCDICHNAALPENTFVTSVGDTRYTLCKNCLKSLGTCATCAKASTCLFETASNNVEKYIIKTTQQGGMTMQQQVPNPEREKITCFICDCWDRDNNVCKRKISQGCENNWSLRSQRE